MKQTAKDTCNTVKKVRAASGRNTGSGNPDNLDEIIQACYGQLLRTARNILKNPADAEDAVQSALYKGVVKYPMFKGNARYCTYLTRIVINESLTLLQKKNLNKHYIEANFIYPHFRHPEETPEENLEEKWIRELLIDIISNMPPAMGSTLYLRFIKNLSYLEISSHLKCSIGTVKSRLLRGKKRLRDKLLKLHPEVYREEYNSF